MDKGTTVEEIGKEVKENNEKIVRYLLELKSQRDELMFLIQKQVDEKAKFEMEMERLTYKLCLINKSMAQRLRAKQNYDATINEIEEKYRKLRENSGDLMATVAKDFDQLDSLLNKKTSTEGMGTPKDSEVETVGSSASSSSEMTMESQEECLCLTNKEVKCIREKRASKMVQAVPLEPEVPTKLEKQKSDEIEKQSEPVQNQETFVQTNPEEEGFREHSIKSSFELQKSRLSRAANQYKDASLRRSL